MKIVYYGFSMGGDEIASSENKLDDPLMNIINSILSKPNIIFLMRPSANHHFHYRPDRQYNLRGFSEFDFPDKYVNKFFGEEDSQNPIGNAKTLLAFLEKSPSIKRLGFTPLNAELICAMWQRDRSNLKKMSTVTDLYHKVIEYILRRELEFQSELKKEADKNKKPYDSLLIEKDESRNPIFYDKDTWDSAAVFTACEPVLHCLSLLAFHAQSYYETDKRLWFSDDDLSSVLTLCVEEKKSRVPMRAAINRVGFLNIQEAGFEFTHLSFQEYLAAVYVAHCLQPENNKELLLPSGRKSNFNDWFAQKKYLSEYAHVWEFTVGTLRQNSLQSELHIFLEQWLSEPRDVFRLNEVLLLIRFLNEGGSILDDKIKNPLIDYVFSFWKRLCDSSNPVFLEKDKFYKVLSASPQLLAESKLINPVIDALKSSSPEALALLQSFVHIDLPKVVITELINILLSEDGSHEYKRKVHLALLFQDPWFYPNTIPNLFKLIRSDRIFLALDALSYHLSIKSVITDLIAMLKDEADTKLRLEVMTVLGQKKALSYSDTIPALIAELQDGDKNNDEIRCGAALALSGQYALSHSSVVSALTDELNNGHDEWLKCVAYALGSYAVLPPYFSALSDFDITPEGHAGYDWMIDSMFTEKMSNEYSAIKPQPDQIKDFHENIVPGLITALGSNNSAVASMAAYVLGSDIALSHQDTIPALIAALGSNHSEVVFAAAYFLGSDIALSHKDTIPGLITKLRSSSGYASSIVYALGKQHELSKDSIDVLIEAIINNTSVKKSASEVLASHKKKLPERDVQQLIEMIAGSQSNSDKLIATDALSGQTTLSNDSIIFLIKAIQTECEKIKVTASHIVSQQTELSKPVIDTLLKGLNIHKDNILAKKYLVAALSNQLALKREDVIEKLNSISQNDEHEAVRKMAVLTLGSYPFVLSKDEVKEVLTTIMLRDSEPNVKMVAARVLHKQSDLIDQRLAFYIEMLKEGIIHEEMWALLGQEFLSEPNIKLLVNTRQDSKESEFLQEYILTLLEMQVEINTPIIKYLLKSPELSYSTKLIAEICYNLNQKVTLNQKNLCLHPLLKDCIELNDAQWSELQSAFQSKVSTLQLPDYNFTLGHFVNSNQIIESFVPSPPSLCNFTHNTTFPNPFLMSASIPDFLHTFMLGLVLKQLGKTTYSYLKSSYQLLKFWWFGDEEALKLHRAKRQVYERYQLGQDCMEEKQWDKAEAHFKVAIELIQSFNFNMYKTECYMALGFTLLEKAHILLDSPYEIDSSITEDEEVSLIDKARDVFLAVKGVSQENDEVIKEELDKLATLYKSCAQPVLAHRCREEAKQLASEMANVNDGLIYVDQLAHESTAGIAAQLGIFAYAKKAPTVTLSKGSNLNTLGKN